MKNDLKNVEEAGEVKTQLSFLASSFVNNYKPSKNTLKKHNILKKLRQNKDIVITRPDKGNGVVILNRKDYNDMMYEILSDITKFKQIDKDLTISRESKLQRALLSLKKKGFFSKIEYEKVYPSGSSVARAYGLPKMHKIKVISDKLKLRPIVSSIKTYNYELSSFLGKLLSPCINKDYCADDTFSFVEDIKKVSSNNKFMVSYDVTSLFTNIPLDETINIAVEAIFEHNPNIKISKPELKKLFKYSTSETHFLFDNKYYDQIDGVAMGSPLGPILANLFMSYHEKQWIEEYGNEKKLFYKRYVDDIFCLVENEFIANDFLCYLNSKHPNIKFTIETENEKKLPFLDVLVTCSENGFLTSVFRKSTFTGLFMNFTSFTPLCYKLGLIKTLVDRTFKICYNWMSFCIEMENVKNLLTKNTYPPDVVDKEIKSYIDKIHNKNVKGSENIKIAYMKLPYIGKFSKFAQKKIKYICETFCKETNVRLVFSSTKISSFFSSKDKLPGALKSFVVYKFICANCNASYVGETCRHLDERINEHLKTKSSHIYKHLTENIACKEACDKSCFQVIDSAFSVFRLKIKEAMHISWLKPELNKQVRHLAVGITV